MIDAAFFFASDIRDVAGCNASNPSQWRHLQTRQILTFLEDSASGALSFGKEPWVDVMQRKHRPHLVLRSTMLYQHFGILCVAFSLFAFGAKATDVEKRTFNGDPGRNITCLGSSYDLQLPIRPDGVDLNELIMQQLCAKPVYGGASIENALGGWCSKGLEPAVWWDYNDDDGDISQG